MVQNRPPAQESLGQGAVAAHPLVVGTEGSEHCSDVVRRGRLAARDPDMVLVDEAQEHAARTGVVDDRRRPPLCRDDHSVEEVPVHQSKPGLLEPGRQVDGAAVDAAGDASQSVGTVVHGVHGGHHGQQHLGGADVRRCLFPADVLLARLQGEPVGGSFLRIDRESDESPGQIAFQPAP